MIYASVKYLLRFSMLLDSLKLKIPMGEFTEEQDNIINNALVSLFNSDSSTLFSGDMSTVSKCFLFISIFVFHCVWFYFFLLNS